MARCEITLTANAGVMLRMGRSQLFIDALHDEKQPGFSALSPTAWRVLAALTPAPGPELIFFTHCHPDHFSAGLARKAAELWPQAALLLPEERLPGQRLLSAPLESMALADASIRFARLPHEGAQFADVAHYGCILEHRGLRVLVTGDCALCAPELARFVSRYGPIDAALVDFPWLTVRRARSFLQQVIRPRRIVVTHLPFQADDTEGYRAAARRAAEETVWAKTDLLLEPFQRTAVE